MYFITNLLECVSLQISKDAYQMDYVESRRDILWVVEDACTLLWQLHQESSPRRAREVLTLDHYGDL